MPDNPDTHTTTEVIDGWKVARMIADWLLGQERQSAHKMIDRLEARYNSGLHHVSIEVAPDENQYNSSPECITIQLQCAGCYKWIDESLTKASITSLYDGEPYQCPNCSARKALTDARS